MHTNSVFQGHALYIAPPLKPLPALLPNAEVTDPYEPYNSKKETHNTVQFPEKVAKLNKSRKSWK